MRYEGRRIAKSACLEKNRSSNGPAMQIPKVRKKVKHTQPQPSPYTIDMTTNATCGCKCSEMLRKCECLSKTSAGRQTKDNEIDAHDVHAPDLSSTSRGADSIALCPNLLTERRGRHRRKLGSVLTRAVAIIVHISLLRAISASISTLISALSEHSCGRTT